ncbi:hypothetical protein LDO31_05935 [Luteimonas sp. XNQY3]|nr:hypothetical protein [Luteimonas sp. XNQY3]MCD9005782.1 hypothetical protein [Luteimonas sp. XNQY3]
MKRISLRRTRKNPEADPIKAWHLDQPRNQSILEDDADLCLRGWVFPEAPGGAVEVILHVDGLPEAVFPADIPAPTARHAVLGEIETHWSIQAAFEITIPAGSRLVAFSFRTAGQTVAFAEIRIDTIFKVQRGLGGHLFLDNDTNRSVDQYTGRLLIDPLQIRGWEAYADALLNLDNPARSMRLLICPAKEEVFGDVYPHKRAALTPVDQVLALCPGHLTRFPLDRLREARDTTYSTVDTHWSDQGAMVGAVDYLESIGLERHAGDLPTRFEARQVYGDLGGKVEGGQHGTFMTLPRDYPQLQPGYDNGIGNHGRIWIYTNAGAPVQETLLIFGDSFSVSLSAILAAVFSRVVYAYTAAGLDTSLIEEECPRHILAQTNQRFLINAPGASIDVDRQAAAKIAKMTPTEREHARILVLSQVDAPSYTARMLRLLDC